jgi:sugar phosphate isomerase/epimerase
MNRRTFLHTTSLAASAPFATAVNASAQTSNSDSKRKFTIDLTPGAIGIKADFPALMELARAHGFESIQPNGGYIASLDAAQRKDLSAELAGKSLVWGAAGLSVDFRGDEEKFRVGLAALPKEAAALRDVGATRVSTWLKPFHDSMTYVSNFKQHTERLGEVTKVLADQGLRFGLEYVGTKTLWTSKRFSFIHTMAETKELIAAVDQPTLGFVLDSWHWFTAGETAEDILTLTNDDVVACDLNDAPKGIAIEDQLDNQRELPAATGVIDIKAFLNAVAQIGYDGPVRAEPFNKPLNQLENEPAAEATANAIRKAIEIAGV